MRRRTGARRAAASPGWRRTAGVSLLELLLVSLLMTVLLAMAWPSFRPLIDRSRVNLAASEFHAAILAARAEALRRGARVDVIPVQAPDWRYGWLVLVDENNNQRFDPGEPLIQRGGSDIAGLQVDARLRDPKKAYLAFDPRGRPRSVSSSQVPQIGSLVFSVGAARRKLIISFLGRVRLCDPDRETATC